ncbi:hypothetical protein [Bathymodiolus thermophilus thioautotrophic gill symbiont]|nr:hypothetical protein [Bathymodiolus thermophilus thioautotrophic gill symbiont]
MINNFYFFSESYAIFKNKLSNLAPILIPSIGSNTGFLLLIFGRL